jgi:predicted DsbA family dithiol-disulfide isomerase
MSSSATIRIDIVSDVVCPWCAIGYAQLQRAVGMLDGRAEVRVRWHPFQLAPDLPPEGQSLADYTRERYGANAEQSSQNRERLINVGASLGLDFRYTGDSRIYNSHRAHQLLAWAGETGGQTALKLALFQSYFTDQANITETGVLLDAVERAGLDRTEANAVLEDGRYAQTVDAEVAYWQDRNITGVPAFIINGSYMIPGAQDAETFVKVLDRVLEKQAA